MSSPNSTPPIEFLKGASGYQWWIVRACLNGFFEEVNRIGGPQLWFFAMDTWSYTLPGTMSTQIQDSLSGMYHEWWKQTSYNRGDR